MNYWLIALGIILLIWPALLLLQFALVNFVSAVLRLGDWAPIVGVAILGLLGTAVLLVGLGVI